MFRPALLVVFLVISNSSVADLWVNVASISTEVRAETARVEAMEALEIDLSVKGAQTKGGYYYRVVAGPYRTRDDAASTLERARVLGYKGVWAVSYTHQTLPTILLV